ncbi:MAG: PspC domain-containing protein [Odoribacteraceae bacterium]|jgi:phage shock protein PspC (stress-responsive transcriptional regulator)|nr:PspC domain-containing protein [Odoribacteraceae bacterium]
MNRVKIIQINGITFNVEEGACETLLAYMEAIKEYFKNEPDAGEIVADIEARIEELLEERPGGRKAVITAADVVAITATLGMVEDIDLSPGDKDGNPAPETPPRPSRRLYRNIDKRLIGGLCSGIAQWMGIRKFVIRLVFILLPIPFYQGPSLPVVYAAWAMLYLLLCIVVPPARSTTQKLEMLGQPVNVSTITGSIKSSPPPRPRRAPAPRPPDNSSKGLRALRVILGALLYIIGLGILLTPLGLLLLEECILAPHTPWELMRFSDLLPHVIHPHFRDLLRVALLAIVLLPSLACFSWGTRLIKRRRVRRVIVHVALFIAWLVALALALGVTAIEIRRHAWTHTIEQTKTTLPAKTLHLETLRAPLQLAHYPPLRVFRDRYHNLLGQPRLSIVESQGPPALEVTRVARSGSRFASRRSGDAIYPLEVRDSLLLFPEFFRVEPRNRWNFQEVRVTLRVPRGTIITTDKQIIKWLLEGGHDANTRFRVINGEQHPARWIEKQPSDARFRWEMTSEGLQLD